MPDSDDNDSASSVSDCSYDDDDSELDDIFYDLCRRDNADASATFAAGPDGQWTHVARSNRSSKMGEGLSQRVLPNDTFNLEYNYADSILLPKARAEVKHSLSALRHKLRLRPDDGFDAVEAFAGAMPELFLRKLFEWLKAGQGNTREPLVSFADIIEFIRCDVILRIYGVASPELTTFGVTADQFKRYKRVRAAMKAADMPAAKRHASAVARSNAVPSAGPAAETFDPIMEEVIGAINNEWAKNFFVLKQKNQLRRSLTVARAKDP